MMTTSGRSIQPPPRSSRFGTVIAIATVILLSLPSFFPSVSLWLFFLAAVFAAAVAAFTRELPVFHAAFFTALLALFPALQPQLRAWPYQFLIPLSLYLAVALAVPHLRKSLLWLRVGTLGKEIVMLVLVIAVASGSALFIWYRLLDPDLSLHLGYMPRLPLWGVPLAAIIFSAGNAAMEELAFRGVVMQATDSAFGPGLLSITVQAWLFGAAHFREGFPNGWWGLAMTFIYGVMLGSLRRRSRGLFAPWLAHVCADLVIFAILAGVGLGK